MFAVGDRVVSIDDIDGRVFSGTTGTIRVISTLSPPIGVEWDAKIHGHNMGGIIIGRNGWYCFPGQIQLLDQSLINFDEVDSLLEF